MIWLCPASRTNDDISTQLQRRVSEIVSEQIVEIAEQLNERLQDDILAECGGLRNLLTEGGRKRNLLPTRMRAAARSTVVDMLQRVDVASILFGGRTDEHDTQVLKECLEAAQPKLRQCGGAKRLLVMLPKGSACVRPLELMHRELNETPSAATNCDGDLVICYELEQMSLTQAAVTLIDGRRDFAEFADRLHTRTDVNWANLPDLV